MVLGKHASVMPREAWRAWCSTCVKWVGPLTGDRLGARRQARQHEKEHHGN